MTNPDPSNLQLSLILLLYKCKNELCVNFHRLYIM
jgi:hypothetical protein